MLRLESYNVISKEEGQLSSTMIDVTYSNQSTVSKVQESARLALRNTQNITIEPDRFKQMLADTMNEIATEASNNLTSKKFTTKEVNFTTFQRLYTLAQYTPDLSISDCNTCLRDSISSLPSVQYTMILLRWMLNMESKPLQQS
ncbi:unnamed protein product [Fraxinus pennsylvanica]|uniref:Gnk2-homologous domain-containing protein n=1 Tax=Fraxinus pennsylvanica TaxID=56036 RepID=A0AAD1ZU72_9LAMI|nr:unnamed protein product [Fraxinus pennsylvanica]